MRDGHSASETSPVEWVIAAVSALLVLSMIGYLLYEEYEDPERPPRITFAIDTIAPSGPGWVVQFRAHNSGDLTAAGLIIEGALRAQGDTSVLERAQATIDYVPTDGSRRAGLFFSRDPRLHDLELQAKGYDLP